MSPYVPDLQREGRPYARCHRSDGCATCPFLDTTRSHGCAAAHARVGFRLCGFIRNDGQPRSGRSPTRALGRSNQRCKRAHRCLVVRAAVGSSGGGIWIRTRSAPFVCGSISAAHCRIRWHQGSCRVALSLFPLRGARRRARLAGSGATGGGSRHRLAKRQGTDARLLAARTQRGNACTRVAAADRCCGAPFALRVRHARTGCRGRGSSTLREETE